MKPRSKTYQIVALALAAWMLIVSVGFTIDMHYCQGELEKISLLGEVNSCEENTENGKSNHCEMAESPCHQEEKSCGHSEDTKGCCDDETSTFQLDTEYPSVQINTLELNQLQPFIVAFVATYFGLIDFDIQNNYFKNYKPPLLDRDISVLIQSFLC